MTINKNLEVKSKIVINAKAEKVWQVLTEPELVKQFLFGTNVSTDWKVGSKISFKGEFNGQTYHDKGNVLENKPFELLKYNYWSGMSGLEDKMENYSFVSYSIKPSNTNSCEFTWHQQGFSSEEGKCHTEEGLKTMLKTIKALAEN